MTGPWQKKTRDETTKAAAHNEIIKAVDNSHTCWKTMASNWPLHDLVIWKSDFCQNYTHKTPFFVT